MLLCCSASVEYDASFLSSDGIALTLSLHLCVWLCVRGKYPKGIRCSLEQAREDDEGNRWKGRNQVKHIQHFLGRISAWVGIT